MKKTLIAVSLMLVLIAGGAYAIDNSAGNGMTPTCPMAAGQKGDSMNHGEMKHGDMTKCPNEKSNTQPDSTKQNDASQDKHDHSGHTVAQ